MATPHRFTWTGVSGASWASASSWLDLTAGGAAVLAPGSLDSVGIVGGLRPVVVTGAGNAASLASYRSVLLDGVFSATTADVEGTLAVAGAGSRLTLGSLGEAGAAGASGIVVAGATLTVSGSATLGSASVSEGGRAQLGASVTISAGIGVDAASCAEVGSGGSFWSGWLKVYAGATLAGSGVIAADTVVSGTVLANGLTFQGLLIGPGSIQIGGDGATVGRVASGTSLSFAAPGAVLTLTNPAQMAGTLLGLAAGDAIDLTGVATVSGAAGVLASLGLAGPQFLLLADGGGGTLALDVAPTSFGTVSAGNATPHRDVWTGLSGGAWGSASSWRDLTAGGAAALAPGSLDSVAVVGGLLPVVVTGAGNAASLATYRSVLLDGVFSATTADVEGTLAVAGAGSRLSLGSLGEAGAAMASSILVAGATLAVSGSATLASASVTGGGRAQLGGSVTISAGIGVDAASCAEVGSGGSFWPGWLKVYAGATLAGSGVIAADTVVSGTVLADGLTFQGLLIGPGSIQIGGDGASVGRVASGTSLTFAAPGAVLTLTNPAQMAGTLLGLAAGEAIDLSGIATVSNAASVLASLGLAGPQFLLLPDGGGGTLALDVAPTSFGTVSAGNATPHRDVWTGVSGAAWNTASSWRDLTAGGAAALAPGSLDSVGIVGGLRPVVVTGAGNAASLASYRSVLLDGVFSATTADVEGTLAVAGAGSRLTLGSLGEAGAAGASGILVAGATLAVSGSATLGSASVSGGGRAQLGATVTMSAGIGVDASSCAEVGSGGSFWPGWLKVYAGATLAGSGVIAADTVVSGTVLANGLTFQGLLVGPGSIQIGGDGASVGRVASGTSLSFAAPGAVLTLTNPAQMAGTLLGLAAGDAIDLSGVAAAGASLSAGELSVFDQQNAVLASFALGPAALAGWSVSPDGLGGTLLVEGAPASPSAWITHPS